MNIARSISFSCRFIVWLLDVRYALFTGTQESTRLCCCYYCCIEYLMHFFIVVMTIQRIYNVIRPFDYWTCLRFFKSNLELNVWIFKITKNAMRRKYFGASESSCCGTFAKSPGTWKRNDEKIIVVPIAFYIITTYHVVPDKLALYHHFVMWRLESLRPPIDRSCGL